MMMPSIFGENLFDDWMDFPFDDDSGWTSHLMMTSLEEGTHYMERMQRT